MSHTDKGSNDPTKLSHGDDHDTKVGADQSAIRRGHEEDITNTSAIWSIPIAVVLFILLGLVVATGTFVTFMNRVADPLANQVSSQRNKAGTNERLTRIGRAGQGNELVDHPRLEGLKIRTGDGMTTSQPAIRIGNFNSPEFHPESLRADRFPELTSAGWVDKKDEIARISIDDAMQIAVKDRLFPVRKDPVKLVPWVAGATQSNAGRGLPRAPAVAPPKKDH